MRLPLLLPIHENDCVRPVVAHFDDCGVRHLLTYRLQLLLAAVRSDTGHFWIARSESERIEQEDDDE